jgi:hypothetical protein
MAATTIHGVLRCGSRAAGSNPAFRLEGLHDLHATLLRCLGIDHTRLTYFYQGRRHRLTDVHGKIIEGILA